MDMTRSSIFEVLIPALVSSFEKIKTDTTLMQTYGTDSRLKKMGLLCKREFGSYNFG
jgi:hypothetical protein